MAWTYNADMTLARDRIRFLVGDTESTDPLVQDGEIALYTSGGQYAQATDLQAAIKVAEAIVRKLARRVSFSAGGTSTQLNQQFEQYSKVLDDLRVRLAIEGGAGVRIGGASIAAAADLAADSDRIGPVFTSDLGDYE